MNAADSLAANLLLPASNLAMVNYYETLKVSPDASRGEIKSAYRRLARKLHPDKNNGSETTARAFAAIAEAYEVLGNPKQRAAYDKRFKANGSGRNCDSLFASSNSHAQRWRQMVYEHRYNEIIDRMIAEERRESLALQKFIFPVVGLFVSTFVVALVRPQLLFPDVNAQQAPSDLITNYPQTFLLIVAVSLFIAGVIHIVGRVREAFDRYTYDDLRLHDSILDETEPPTRMFSRYSMTAVFILGLAASFAIGLAMGYGLDQRWMASTYLFKDFPDFLGDAVLLPPIFVLVVDAMHGLVLRADV